VILDWQGVSVPTEEGTAEYPRPPAQACGRPLPTPRWRGVEPHPLRSRRDVDLDENLPASILRHLDGLISAQAARD